jgi:hypothetical protein
MSGFALPETGPPWNRHVQWMPLEAEAGCPCRSRPARLWRRIERVLRPGLRYDLGQPPAETTLVARPDLDNLTAGDLVRLGELARHLDGRMKVELAFDEGLDGIEPNGYVLRDTSWQEYCPMPETISTSDSAGQEGAETSSRPRSGPGAPGRTGFDLHDGQRRGDDVHRVSLIKRLYRRLERHWIFYPVGRQVVTENERKIGRTVDTGGDGLGPRVNQSC